MSFDFSSVVTQINNVLWGQGQLLIYMLLFAGIWFSFRLSGLQISGFGHMFGLLGRSRGSDKFGISPFQALCTSLSARVGTGNLAGVAIALTLGGPGAIFWMWVIALLGMATGFAESLLGQVYKVKDSNGEFRGGPAYYIRQGLGYRWMAILFSVCLFVGYGFIFSATQANTIVDSLNYAYDFPPLYSGLAITIAAALVVIGGLRAIARFAEIIVPFMGFAYLLLAIGITLINLPAVPGMLSDIILSAFGFGEAGAGMLAAAIKNGIQRGLYSNEAGAGSVPQAAAAASSNPKHPATQGYLQMLGVFLDTIVLCTCTAFIILLAAPELNGKVEGIRLTQAAMTFHLGDIGSDFVSIAITLFAFTSIVANYAYAEANLHFFKLDNRFGRTVYTLIFLSMMLWGSGVELTQVWATADMALGLMTVVNVVAIILLTPTVIAVTRDYKNKISTKQNVTFSVENCAIQGQLEDSSWAAKE